MPITNDLKLVIEALKSGKAVAIPTETVYGLAAMIHNEQAIRSIFSLKNRPLNHPLIVHVSQNWNIESLVKEIPPYAKVLMTHFWPGPLTLVFKVKENSLNPLITGGQATIAIRCPYHPLAQKLLEQLNTPLVAPSANPFGKISPTTALHVKESFTDTDLLILDGGRCSIGIESTIIDVTQPQSYQILRHGLINEVSIGKVCSTACLNINNNLRVPGKLKHHYQPKKKLYYFKDFEHLSDFCQKTQDTVYVLANTKPKTIDDVYFFPLANDPKQAAFELYFQLRKADESNASSILIELPSKTSAWEGLRERILKAGQAGYE